MEVRDRYYNEGSEFGKIHRLLDIKNSMFDIDRLYATISVDISARKEDASFVEYNTDWTSNSVKWKALFEIKYREPHKFDEMLTFKTGTAHWAQLKLCEKIECRYFIVISTQGIQPFKFYEINYDGSHTMVGILEYSDSDDKKDVVKKFWNNILKLN